MVSHPKKTRYIAEARIKSDRVDSKVMPELARLDALPLAYVPDKETADLREKVRRRAFLVRERVKLRVKIKSFLTYERIKWPSDHGLFTRKGIEWLGSLKFEPKDYYVFMGDKKNVQKSEKIFLHYGKFMNYNQEKRNKQIGGKQNTKNNADPVQTNFNVKSRI